MKVFLFCTDPVNGDAPWLPPEAAVMRVFVESLGACLLPMPVVRRHNKNRLLGALRRRRTCSQATDLLCKTVKENIASDEPAVLIQMVFGNSDLQWVKLLEPVWDRFTHRVLYVNDTFQPHHARLDDLNRFDEIMCFCGDLAEEFQKQTGIPSSYWPAHSDVLNFHNVREHRPIDLIVVGRRDSHWHGPLHRYFNDPAQDRIFLDFVSRTQGDQPAKEQFETLMSTYGRSKGAFCFEPSAVPRFCNRSPILNRWIHSWAAGNTIFGTIPTGKGTEAQMDWEDSIIEIHYDLEHAKNLIEDRLSDRKRLRTSTLRNVSEALARHDTRIRIRGLLEKLDLEVPERLATDLVRLRTRREEIKRLLT